MAQSNPVSQQIKQQESSNIPISKYSLRSGGNQNLLPPLTFHRSGSNSKVTSSSAGMFTSQSAEDLRRGMHSNFPAEPSVGLIAENLQKTASQLHLMRHSLSPEILERSGASALNQNNFMRSTSETSVQSSAQSLQDLPAPIMQCLQSVQAEMQSIRQDLAVTNQRLDAMNTTMTASNQSLVYLRELGQGQKSMVQIQQQLCQNIAVLNSTVAFFCGQDTAGFNDEQNVVQESPEPTENQVLHSSEPVIPQNLQQPAENPKVSLFSKGEMSLRDPENLLLKISSFWAKMPAIPNLLPSVSMKNGFSRSG